MNIMKIDTIVSKCIIAILLTFFVTTITNAQVDTALYSLNQVQVSVGQKSISACSDTKLIITGVTASNYASISWSTTGDGYFSKNTDLNPTYSLGLDEMINGKVYLVVTANGIDGCSSIKDTVTVTVNSVFFSINDSDFTTCQNVSTHLIAKVLKGAGGYTYEWSPSTYLDKTTGSDVIFTPSSSTTISYQCTITDELGCKGYNQLQIKVNPSPTVTISNPKPSLCVGSSVTLLAAQAAFYNWNTGDVTPTITKTPTITTTYTVTGTNPMGCWTTATTIVTVNPYPTITVTALPSVVSVGKSSQITATGALSYNWSNGLGSGTTQIVSPQITTSYTVSATNNFGCAVMDSVTVTVITTNKIALLKMLNEADSLLSKAPEGLIPGKYPPIAFENLKNVSQNAQNVYSDTKASQAHIDSTVSNLSNAIVLFKAAKIYNPTVPVKYIAILEGNHTVQVNKSFALHAQIYPSNASNQQINWYFKNTKDTLDKGYLGNGSVVTLTPPQIGNYLIYAYSNEYYISGKDTVFHHDSVSIVVAPPVLVSKITVNTNVLKIVAGTSDNSIVATVWPLTASNKNLLWSSKDETIATISPLTGAIIGVSEGTAIITIISVENPLLMQTITVYVYGVSVDKSKLESTLSDAEFIISTIDENTDIGTNVGQYDNSLWYELNKIYGTAKDEFYSSVSTENSVYNSVFDLLSAIAKFKNSKVGATYVNLLSIKPEDISLSISSAPYQLNAIVLPIEASNKSLVWESSDETVVTVDKNGLVTVVGGGSAFVIATTTDGSIISDSTTITVIVPVKSISLPQVVGLQVNTAFYLSALVLPRTATDDNLVWSSSDTSIVIVDSNGYVSGLKPGSAKILVQSADGQVTAMTIINVSLEAIPTKSITLPDTLHLLFGEIQTLNAIIQPYNATNSIINWASSNASSLSVDYKGELTAWGVDTVVVYAYSNDDETIFDSTIVYINASKAPEVFLIKPITLQEGSSSISIPLSKLVVDDKTSISNLEFIPNTSNNFTIEIVDDSLIITPINPNVAVSENVSFSVVDQDGQSVTVTISVSISSSINKAPVITEIPKQAITVGGTFIPVLLPLYVSDDYTKQEDITWSVKSNTIFKTSVNFNNLYVEPVSNTWIGLDSLLLIAKDKNGDSSTIYIQYSISNKANEAPNLAQIPVQEQTNTTAFQPIVLSKYVIDDYTPSLSITWTASKSNKVNTTIVGGKAFITVIDKNWTGSDVVVFTATDQGGLSSTVSVFFNQKATVSQVTWAGKPEVSFTAERTKVGSKELVKFHGSITGQASDGAEWTFEGGSPAQSYDLNPVVSYDKLGAFDVTFVAGNNGEIDSSVISDYITVVGISTPDTILCPGTSAVLSVSDKTLTKYQWSNGDKTASISVSPSVDTKYSVTAQSGLVKFYDTVLVTVSKPVSLGNDTAICEGSTLTYTLQGFATYKWNNITSFNKNTFKTSTPQNISVEVKDVYGCVSSAGVEVSVNALPTVSLGVDDSICPSVKKVLDPGNSFNSYKWNDGTVTQTKEVTISDNYSVTVTDANGCKNSDNVTVVVKQTYAEQLGVATYSDNGSNIILAWERTKGKNTEKYEVLREYETDKYEVIGNTLFNEISIVVDSTSNSNQQAYKYKLRTYDACGSSVESEPHRTMFVTSNYNSLEQKINLEWNRYEGIALTKYTIYELNKQTGDTLKIGSVPASKDIQKFSFSVNNPKDGYQYRVGYTVPYFDPKVTKSDGGPFSQSLSNMAESELVGTQIEDLSQVKVYPNPAQIQVSITSTDFKMEEIEILDVLGNCVYKSSKFENKNKLEICIESFTAGIYTVRIKGNDSVKTTLFIKD